ncbi:MAG: alkaline phosphatase family protein [Anaerolineae bacterium]|nr:alkaline phosphatase family protein [Anaerolineae bacterium]
MDVEALEQTLRTYRPEGITGFPEEFVWPRYDGISVGNLAATITGIFGVPATGMLPPLRDDLLGDMVEGVERVLLLVVDALGWSQLQRTMTRHPDLFFHRLAARGRLLPITTTFLSTTNSVLSTIWTGRPPIEHGMLAFEMFLREWAMAVESISFSPMLQPFGRVLEQWGFDPEAFLPVPSLAHVLAVQGILTYNVISKYFTQTPLSRMHFRGVRRVIGHTTASDFWVTLRRVLHSHRDERCLLSGYWSAVDTLAHNFGPRDETGEAEIWSFATLMEELFFNRLSAAERKGTLLLMTADHGQMTASQHGAVLWTNYPDLQGALSLPPLGESRAPFLYVRSGKDRALWQDLQARLSDRFHWMRAENVLASGLLGPGQPFAEVPHRLGDIVGIAKGKAYLARSEALVDKLRGRHGGLAPEEMLVPLLAVRLDA